MPASPATFPVETTSTSTSDSSTIIKRATHPTVVSIPGSHRVTTRRSASNSAASINVFLVRDIAGGPLATLKAAVTRKGRVMGLALKGHKAQVIDLEFLQTPKDSAIHVLGSCDAEGVVFLWFLYVAKDKLGVDVGLRLLRKYSFYSLRKSSSAYYSRIRLAGTVAKGTMVIVPNDGSNVRVVTFTCEPEPAINPTDMYALPAPDSADTPLLTAPESVEESDSDDSNVGDEYEAADEDINNKTLQEDIIDDEPPAARYMPTPTASGNYSGVIEAEGKQEMEGVTEYEGQTKEPMQEDDIQEEDTFVDAADLRNVNIEDHTRDEHVQEDIGQHELEEYEEQVEEEVIDDDDTDSDDYEVEEEEEVGIEHDEVEDIDPRLRHLHTAKEDLDDRTRM